MTDRMVNGILFIIAGLGSIAVYLALGETGLLDKGHTEKIAAYTLVTIPLAFMMTRNVARNNLVPGIQIKIGSAMVEVSEKPHTGCKKFSSRFGLDALKFISTPSGRELCLRGINTRIVQSGVVQTGDVVKKHNVEEVDYDR